MASAEPEPEPEPPTQLEPEPEPSTQQLQATDEVAAFEATHVATPGPSLYTPTVTKTGCATAARDGGFWAPSRQPA